MVDNVQLRRLPCAWHTQLPGLPESSALQVPGETPGPATSALAGASSTAGPLLSLVFNPERGSIPSYILTFIKEHDCARRKPVFCWSKLCSVQFGSQIWWDARDRGLRLPWARSRAGVHSSPRDKTTSLLVGSLCGAAPAPRRCAEARWG